MTVHLEHNPVYVSYSGVQDTTRYTNFYDRQGQRIGWFVWDIRLGKTKGGSQVGGVR